ncbi:glycosyltransferase family 2 protein [Clostridium botulinum]|nr:glycosyltransferase family 2 protein [Clostridium botulinum]NFP27699.1 glycosyltransferase family 2 protein [Clostridium botulinum]
MLDIWRNLNLKDLVSIIIPVYNSSKTIKETIKSVLVQNYKKFEIIVIDDCSTDESFEILKCLSDKDKKINLYRNKKNLGVSKTRNLGIELAKGEFICFLDSDDIWNPLKLEEQIKYINKQNSDICYTSYEMIDTFTGDKSIRIIPKDINYKGLLKENIICCSTIMIKSNLLKENKFEENFFHEDFVLWLKLLKLGFKAAGLEKSLVTYRKGGRSSNKSKASINRWIVYRKSERLSLIMSIYYFICYTINGIKKYYV